MAISDRDRKLLWARSGNRCALCREVLIRAASEVDRESIVGDEAHIISAKEHGPRHVDLPSAAYDAHENLILLCRLDHRLIDDQPMTYPTALLHRLKDSHEAWVSETLGSAVAVGALSSELPRVRQGLVNRQRELAELSALLEASYEAPGPSVALLTGMPGVGKSAVGQYWAVRNRLRFNGGALFGDFAKHRHDGSVRMDSILGEFLRELGTPESAIPPTLGDRQRMFRRLTASKRLLIYMDNAEEPAQVNAILPAGGGSLVIVTSNHRLDGLLDEGARHIPVDPLGLATSQDLLSSMIGGSRASAEPDALAELAELCGGLPIALCVCGGTLAGSGRDRTVQWLVDGIRRSGRRVRALSRQGSLSLESVLDFAYQGLPHTAALVYRRLGDHPGRDLTLPVAAALADISIDEAAAALSVLHDAYLVETPSDERYAMHDLVADHAAGQSERYDIEATRDAAVRRAVDWYYAALRRADYAQIPDRLRLAPDEPMSVRDLPDFTSPQSALTWVTVERGNILALVREAFNREWHDRVWQICEATWLFYLNHKWFADWEETNELAVRSARSVEHRAAEARMRAQLSRALGEQGRIEEASREMRQAVDAAADSGHEMLMASTREFVGHLDVDRGDFAGAVKSFGEARMMFEALKYPRGVALQDFLMGKSLVRVGRYPEALGPLTSALEAMDRLGGEPTVARVLIQRAEAYHALSLPASARSDLDRAITVARYFGVRFDEAQAFEVLATVARAEGHPDDARTYLQSAYRLYKEIGHPLADGVLRLLT